MMLLEHILQMRSSYQGHVQHCWQLISCQLSLTNRWWVTGTSCSTSQRHSRSGACCQTSAVWTKALALVQPICLSYTCAFNTINAPCHVAHTHLRAWSSVGVDVSLGVRSAAETYMNVVKQTTSKMALSSAETQQRFAAASVPWSPDLLQVQCVSQELSHETPSRQSWLASQSPNTCPSSISQGVRRAAMQPAKLYLERVLHEVGNLGNSQSARANALTLLRSALRLGAQVGHKLQAASKLISCLSSPAALGTVIHACIVPPCSMPECY